MKIRKEAEDLLNPAPYKAGTGLAVLETLTPDQVFGSPAQAAGILAKIHIEVGKLNTHDVTTPAGQTAIKSLARKVASSKTLLDNMGKALTEEWKRKARAIDEARADIRTNLDKLRDDVRRPVTEIEEREEARKAAHNAALAGLREWPRFDVAEPTSAMIAERLAQLDGVLQRDWEEFSGWAAKEGQAVKVLLTDMLARARQREADAAELERLRKLELKREAIAQLTPDDIEAINRKLVENDTKAKKPSASKLSKERKKHKEKINAEIIAALVKRKLTPRQAAALVDAIAAGQVPYLSVCY